MEGEIAKIKTLKAKKVEEGYWWHTVFLESLRKLESKIESSEKAKKIVEYQIRKLEEAYIDKIIIYLEKLIIKYSMYELSDRVIKSHRYESDNEVLVEYVEYVYDNYCIEKHIHVYKHVIREALKKYIETWCNTDYKVTIDYSFNLRELKEEEKMILEVYLDIYKKDKLVESFKIAEVRIY